MAADPLFAFGSHGASHRPMTRLDDAALRGELVGSAVELERLTGRRAWAVAYPFGEFDGRVAAAAECGYRAGFAVHDPPPGPMTLPRIPVHTSDNRRRLAFKLSRWYRPARRLVHAGRAAAAPGASISPLGRVSSCSSMVPSLFTGFSACR